MRPVHLLIISEREALSWVLQSKRMAFPSGRAAQASRLQDGDRLLLYTTRGCFHNPTKHRGRVMGQARVASPVEMLSQPVEVAGRMFHLGCDLDIDGLAEPLGGLELAPLVPELTSFPRKDTWAASLRRPLVPLTDQDAELLTRLLADELRLPKQVLSGWLALSRPRRLSVAGG